MGQESQVKAIPVEELRAQIVSVMEDLQLPAPQRMLSRIEKMLPERDRERVLRQILADFQQQSKEEIKRILKVLAPGRDEWAREIEMRVAELKSGDTVETIPWSQIREEPLARVAHGQRDGKSQRHASRLRSI